MSDKKLDEIFETAIEKTSKETAKEVVAELKKQGMIKENKQSPFQKTETLLYNYNNFLAAINDKVKQIETIETEGVSKKSNSITCFIQSDGLRENKSDAEKAEEKIDAIENSIHVTQNFIRVIDEALNSIKEDPYFDIIPMKYMNGVDREEIAEWYGVDASTISRNKNRLINSLQIRLFSDEVIYQIFS